MKGIILKIILGFLVGSSAISQSAQVKGVVVDKSTKLPLENVVIFNERDNSTTNKEGAFVFVSTKNQINFNLLGYYDVATSFDALANRDTIFMDSKAMELKEVVIINAESFMKKVFDRMGENFIQEYTTDFFLRNVLKKDTTLVSLQDLTGKRNRSNENKDIYSIEILNMRKVSLLERKKASLKFPDFKEFFSPPFPIIDGCYFKEEDFADKDYRKISFLGKQKNEWGQRVKGYFIIDPKDYAIVEYSIEMIDVFDSAPFKRALVIGPLHRTSKYNRLYRYSKDNTQNKYFLSGAKIEIGVEVLDDKKQEKGYFLNLSMDYFITSSISTEKVKSNFSIDKDIFEAKFQYSSEFWNNQNQLPLTLDLKSFSQRVNENKAKKREYEFIGNF
jgi:hypothetical protein